MRQELSRFLVLPFLCWIRRLFRQAQRTQSLRGQSSRLSKDKVAVVVVLVVAKTLPQPQAVVAVGLAHREEGL
jgi:hypothetical protein